MYSSRKKSSARESPTFPASVTAERKQIKTVMKQHVVATVTLFCPSVCLSCVRIHSGHRGNIHFPSTAKYFAHFPSCDCFLSRSPVVGHLCFDSATEAQIRRRLKTIYDHSVDRIFFYTDGQKSHLGFWK